jgi:NAD(P)-dependent dehydrogenase (short-subunit alcohol dehydrogenase family)
VTLLSDKAVVVTGAGNGLGRDYALFVGRMGAGVVVNDIDRDAADRVCREISTFGGVGVASYSSVASWKGARSIISLCIDSFGGVDGLVNNAGVLFDGKPWMQSERGIRTTIEVNLLGSIFCSRHAIEAMLVAGSGSIVNISSAAMWGVRDVSTYGASKGALTSLTYGCAVDLLGTGIRINSISPNAPSQIHARSRRMLAELQPLESESAHHSSFEEIRDLDISRSNDNAALVCFLLSDLSMHVNGQHIQIRNGQISLIPRPRSFREPGGLIVERNGWTVDAIAEVFSSSLSDEVHPIGDYLN